jgi:hypothetical protein
VNDPVRLLQDAPSELETELLRSVATERPTFEHRVRVRQAMGLAAGGSLAPSAGISSLGASKMAIAGLVAAGAIAALIARGTFSRESPAPSATLDMVAAPLTPAAAAEPSADPPEASRPGTGPFAPVGESQALPSAGAPPSPIPRAMAITPSRSLRDSKNTTTEATGVSDISAQIGLIDQAHAALHANDSAAAIRTVNLYASRYPRGAFGQEATVIRIEALDQSGNHARAASLARAFLAKHPASAHAKRLERIAGN